MHLKKPLPVGSIFASPEGRRCTSNLEHGSKGKNGITHGAVESMARVIKR
jgi:hypothetical protein